MPWTKRLMEDPQALETLIRPESALERRLLKHPDFRQGLLWGEPRFGHPEGKVAIHVREVLDNIDLIQILTAEQRAQLRLVAIAHDAFKFREDRSHPRDWTKHHGLLARHFMAIHTTDPIVLDLIETHDDAYYAWLGTKHETFLKDNPHKSLDHLIRRIGHCLQLYYLFFKCDTQTGDKTQASLKWFEREVEMVEIIKIRD
jgi:hypothetical protein